MAEREEGEFVRDRLVIKRSSSPLHSSGHVAQWQCAQFLIRQPLHGRTLLIRAPRNIQGSKIRDLLRSVITLTFHWGRMLGEVSMANSSGWL